MPNSILPQDNDGQELFNAISSFFSMFGIGKLLRMCNSQKEKGVPVIQIFKYKLCNIFADRSMYMQQRTGSFRESFSKNTFYRFLSNSKINWLRFTSLLSQKVAGTIETLTDEKRVNAFVVDDTLLKDPVARKQNSCRTSQKTGAKQGYCCYARTAEGSFKGWTSRGLCSLRYLVCKSISARSCEESGSGCNSYDQKVIPYSL